MKKMFSEFKKFITRGNVLDLAVGIIIGSAFTAIVNALTNGILKPLINWLIAFAFGDGDGLTSAMTYLKKVYSADGTIDLTKSIYIDWGGFITAIINFFLVALVLFYIVRSVNRLKEIKDTSFNVEKRAEYKKAHKLKLSKREVKALELKAEREAQAKQKAEEEALKKAEEEAKLSRTEQLLTDIKALLSESQTKDKSENQTKDKSENQIKD